MWSRTEGEDMRDIENRDEGKAKVERCEENEERK